MVRLGQKEPPFPGKAIQSFAFFPKIKNEDQRKIFNVKLQGN